jgi:hypothetical protein
MTLSVLIPNTIADANFISSSVAETDYPAWVIGTTYALGDYVISTVSHRIYQSAVAGNVGKDPTAIKNQMQDVAGIIYWVDKGPTNKWALFDNTVSTQTITASPLVIVAEPGFFNAVYFDNLEANTLQIVVKDAPDGAVIYDSGVVTLEGSAPSDYYEYFFESFKPLKKMLLQNVTAYYPSEVTITLTGITVKCGIIAFGDLRPLGTTLSGAKAKPKTYSYIATDNFGNTSIKRRKTATDMSCTAFLDIQEATTVLDNVQAVLDVPCVWAASECINLAGLTVFGLGSGELTYPDSSKAELSLNVQGLI